MQAEKSKKMAITDLLIKKSVVKSINMILWLVALNQDQICLVFVAKENAR